MKPLITGRRAYAWLLRLYPRHFQAEYGDEMLDVFTSALADASRLGFRTGAAAWLRELRDLPLSVVRERRLGAETGAQKDPMDTEPGRASRDGGSGPTPERPASWREALAGASLFALLPLLSGVLAVLWRLFGEQGPRTEALYASAGGALWGLLVAFFMAIACFSWVRGFPRWSFPYLGFGLLALLFQRFMTTPGTTVFGHEIGSLERWLWRAFIPALVVAVAALLITRSVQPLRKLAQDVWNDWSRICFLLYGMMPIALVVSFDEVHGSAPILEGLCLGLGAGALAYMRSTRPLQRVTALVGGLGVSWLAATVWLFAYWHGRQEPWMAKPTDGYETAIGMSAAGAVLIAILLAPGLLGLARRAVRGHRPVSS